MTNFLKVPENQVEPREIVKLIAEDRGISNRKLAEMSGISEQNLSNMINGGRTLSDKSLVKLSDALQIPFDTLRLGKDLAQYLKSSETEKYKPGINKEVELSTLEKDKHSPYNGIYRGSSDKANMWVVTAKAQGGFIVGFANRMFRSMIDRVPFPLIAGECFSFEIEGFSMYPAYEPGARIVCTFLPDKGWLRKGKTYVFQTHDGLVIKNFEKVEGDKIYLESENPNYNPVNPIRTDDLVQLYEIEYVISRPPNRVKPAQ